MTLRSHYHGFGIWLSLTTIVLLTSFGLFWSASSEQHILEVRQTSNSIEIRYDNQTLLNEGEFEDFASNEPLELIVEHDLNYFLLPSKEQSNKLLISPAQNESEILRPQSNFYLFPHHPYRHPFELFTKYEAPLISAKFLDLDQIGITRFEKIVPGKEYVLVVQITNPAVIELQQGNNRLWLRPKWHHETVLATESQIFIGEQVGLNLSTLGQRFASIIFFTITIASGILWIGLLLTILVGPAVGHIKTPTKFMSVWRYLAHEKLAVSVLALCFFVVTASVSTFVFDKLPHSQDDLAYLFQAKVFSHGRFFLPSLPSEIRIFFDHEFIQNNGKWFGTFPPGISLVLALGHLIGLPHLINPIVGTANMILLFVLTRQYLGRRIAFVASVLYVLSPFYNLIAASFLSHPITLTGILLMLVFWNKKLFFAAGLSLGTVFLSRPFTGALVLMAMLTWIVFLYGKGKRFDWRQISDFGYGMTIMLFFLCMYNYILTGHVFRLPYQEYSPYNTIGFGPRGTHAPLDFGPLLGLENSLFNLYSLTDMLFPFPLFMGLVFVPLAFVGKHLKIAATLLLIFLLVVTGYSLYFNPGTYLGPRFWYELGLTTIVLSALGLSNLYDILFSFTKSRTTPLLFVVSMLALLVSLHHVSLAHLESYNGIFARKLPAVEKPAVIVVENQQSWQDYGNFLATMDPILENNEVIFVRETSSPLFTQETQTITPTLITKYFSDRYCYYLKGNEISPCQ